MSCNIAYDHVYVCKLKKYWVVLINIKIYLIIQTDLDNSDCPLLLPTQLLIAYYVNGYEVCNGCDLKLL